MKIYKIVSEGNNPNSSRITLELKSNDIFPFDEVKEKFNLSSFSKNMRIESERLKKNNISYGVSFGTISFNKGQHKEALEAFKVWLDN